MELKRTPLFEYIKEQGGKFVPFAGWEMAVYFEGKDQGITKEHLAVRESVGLFDVSHMGEILCVGVDAEIFLNYICSNNLTKITDGGAQYSLLLNEKGGVVDDLIIYRLAADHFLLCVNASNKDQDFHWLVEQSQKFNVFVTDVSGDYGQIALQGPLAFGIIEKISAGAYSNCAPFTFIDVISPFNPAERLIIARTGYTGEDGGEIFVSAHYIESFVRDLKNKFPEIVLCGLGARDTLRLEASLPLHGHELRPDIPAGVCRVGWAIDKNNPNKFGVKKAFAPSFLKLAGFIAEPGLIPREGMKIYHKESYVGWVTSGTRTPKLQKNCLLAFVEDTYLDLNLEVDIRGTRVKINQTTLPFYKRLTKLH